MRWNLLKYVATVQMRFNSYNFSLLSNEIEYMPYSTWHSAEICRYISHKSSMIPALRTKIHRYQTIFQKIAWKCFFLLERKRRTQMIPADWHHSKPSVRSLPRSHPFRGKLHSRPDHRCSVHEGNARIVGSHNLHPCLYCSSLKYLIDKQCFVYYVWSIMYWTVWWWDSISCPWYCEKTAIYYVRIGARWTPWFVQNKNNLFCLFYGKTTALHE